MDRPEQTHAQPFAALPLCPDEDCSLCFTRKALAVLYANKGARGLARYGARVVFAIVFGDRDTKADLWFYLFKSVEWEEVAFKTVGGFRGFVSGMHAECIGNHTLCAGAGVADAVLPMFE